MGKMTEKKLMVNFGNKIRYYRNLKGWSQETLAERMKVSKNTISEVENGKKFVRARRLIQFSEIFEIDIFKFFMPDDAFLFGDPVGVLSKINAGVKEIMENSIFEYSKKNDRVRSADNE